MFFLFFKFGIRGDIYGSGPCAREDERARQGEAEGARNGRRQRGEVSERATGGGRALAFYMQRE